MRKVGRGRRGIALMSVLFMMLVLMMLVNALLILARQQALVSRSAYDREAALFTVDAGVAEAQSRLEVDPTWSTDLVDQSMESVPGAFTIRWNTSGTNFQPWESVNNMSSPDYADSIRGADSVPPRSALLVVTARVGTMARVGEVLLTRYGTVGTARPIMSSGNLRFQGKVRVDGVKSLATGVPVASGIHTGIKSGATGTITWTQNQPDDEATVTGKVSTVNPAAGAIDFGPDSSVYFLGGEETDAKPEAVRRVDIPQTIEANSGEPALPPGTTAVGPGEWYYPGDLVINGDLTLNNAALYVNGKLTVNGSITGRGSLYVGGDTSFQGDSVVQSQDALHVGLFSHGSVRLTGFDGSAYLDDMANPSSPNYDPEMAVWWPEAKGTLEALQDLMDSNPNLGNLDAEEKATVESMVQKLGEETAVVTPYGDPAGDIDVLGRIRDKVALRTPGPTEAFLVEKLASLRSLYQIPEDAGAAIANFQANGDATGLVAAVASSGEAALWPTATSLAHRTEFDKIGTSHFNGVVYTAGGFHAENEVNIVGALLAISDTAGTTTFPDGTVVPWGDVRLKTGTRVTFVEDYFDNNALSTPGAGYVTVDVWLGR